MALVVRVAALTIGQRPARVNVHPHWRGVPLPALHREALVGVCYGLGIDAWLAHRHQIVWESLSAHGAVFFDLLVEQAERLGALHCRYRVFPDADLGVENPTFLDEHAYQLAAKVLDSDIAVPHLGCRQVPAME